MGGRARLRMGRAAVWHVALLAATLACRCSAYGAVGAPSVPRAAGRGAAALAAPGARAHARRPRLGRVTARAAVSMPRPRLGLERGAPALPLPLPRARTARAAAGARARALASDLAPPAEERPAEDGGKKPGSDPPLLRLIRLFYESAAAALARALRPVVRALRPLESLLRAFLRDAARRRVARVLLSMCSLFVMGVFASSLLAPPSAPALVELPYSSFLQLVQTNAPISNLAVSLKRLEFVLDGRPHFSRPVLAAPHLLDLLIKKGVHFRAPAPSRYDSLGALALPLIWLAGLGFLYSRQARQMTSNVGKRASAAAIGEPLTFDDVQGIDAAKSEVQEIVAMLREPAKYLNAGVRLPSGILLAGPPGTGKTLLARVLACEAGVPFFYCSGSDFVEIFVGRGASRLRSLFVKAGKLAPCVIFIDELDALGKRRSLRLTGSNDEVEQTLNQLLACMDGLDSSNNGVIVVGATNRASILDQALIRPGRFDRVVQIELPDVDGRADILGVHAKKLVLDEAVDLLGVAALAQGMSGAELAAITNEAAIRMVRRGGSAVQQRDYIDAVRNFQKSRMLAPPSLIDKIILGNS